MSSYGNEVGVLNDCCLLQAGIGICHPQAQTNRKAASTIGMSISVSRSAQPLQINSAGDARNRVKRDRLFAQPPCPKQCRRRDHAMADAWSPSAYRDGRSPKAPNTA